MLTDTRLPPLLLLLLLLLLQDYLHSANLATYLGLHPVDGLHMSVPLNLVFIGFQSDGNAKVRKSPQRRLQGALDCFAVHCRRINQF
jgi:hypothetical protein